MEVSYTLKILECAHNFAFKNRKEQNWWQLEWNMRWNKNEIVNTLKMKSFLLLNILFLLFSNIQQEFYNFRQLFSTFLNIFINVSLSI